MGNRWTSSRVRSSPPGIATVLLIAGLCGATWTRPSQALAQPITTLPPAIAPPPAPPPPAPPPPPLIQVSPYHHGANPGHFRIGDEYYPYSIAGLGSYLETIRSTNSALYQQLAPDLERLRAKSASATGFSMAGVALGVASFIAGVATRESCHQPSVQDPSFVSVTNDWTACTEANTARFQAFGVIGMVAVLGGLIAASAVTPRDADIIAFVNKHNHLTTGRFQIQMGFDPQSRVALGGATLTF